MKKTTITLLVLLLYSSVYSQSGITWNASADIAITSFGKLHPRVAMDRSGDPMVVWGRLSDQSAFFSRWNGSAFTTPVKLNPTWMNVATADWMGPDIASHGDTVYVAVKRWPEAADTNRVFVFASFDAGATFNPPVELAFIADTISRFPTVTTDAVGNPIVGFMKIEPNMMSASWVVSRSSDYGATFSPDVMASGWGGSQSVCDCCPGSLASSGDTTVMMYRNNNNNLRDSWAGISTDNAATFNSGFAIDNNNWVILNCPSTGPDGVIVNDTLYSVFMNGFSGSQCFFSKTDLVSGNLSSVTMIANPAGLSYQNFPRIASDGVAVGAVWRQTVNGITQLPIRFTNNITNGLTTVYDTVDLNNVTNTDIGIANGKVVVVWEDDNSGTVKYRMGTFVPVNTGVEIIESGNVNLFPNPSGNIVSIQLPHNQKTERVTFYDEAGKICIDKMISANTAEIDVSLLKSGVYQVMVKTNEGTFVKKFSR